MARYGKMILESISSSAIYDLSKYLLFVFLSGISGVAAHICAGYIYYLTPYAVILSISAAAGAGFLGMYLYKRHNPILRVFSKVEFKYSILSKECFYEYKDSNHMIYEKHLKLKVLCKNLDRYYDKYNWTGCGKINIISADKDHEIIQTIKRDSFQQFEVHFGRNYKKNQIIDLQLTFELEDTENKANPNLSTTIVEPTKYLKLGIKMPDEYKEYTADAEVFPLIDSRIPLEKHIMNSNNNGVIEWEINNPELLLVYSLKWKKINN